MRQFGANESAVSDSKQVNGCEYKQDRMNWQTAAFKNPAVRLEVWTDHSVFPEGLAVTLVVEKPWKSTNKR
jgi:hypothetical protein